MASAADATIGGGPPIPPHKISYGYVESITVSVVFTTVATGAVALRFLSRRLTKSTGWDDWTSLIALVFAYGFMSIAIIAGTYGRAGYHFISYTVPQLETYLKIALANNVIYNCSVTMSKVSVLLFYRRIFVQKTFKIAFWVLMFMVVGNWLGAFFGLIFTADPVRAYWEFWLPNTTIHEKAFWVASGIINTILDFAILCLPQPLVWNLHLATQRKVLLSLLFLCGFFTCITSIVRIVYLETIDFSDVTYTITAPGIWTLIETNMSIICGCAPVWPNLFRKWFNSPVMSNFKLSFNASKSSWRKSLKRSKDSSSGSYDSDRAPFRINEKGSIGSHHSQSQLEEDENKYKVRVERVVDISLVERGEGNPRASEQTFIPEHQ